MQRIWRAVERRKSRQIIVGGVPIGGDAPITVQSMTNTPTENVEATLEQIEQLAKVGADLVRVSCPTPEAGVAMDEIVRHAPVPIIADIHFHYARALDAARAGVACLRINPGNIGDDGRVREVVTAAKEANITIRIGVNAGSLEREILEKYREPCPEAMVESALIHVRLLEEHGFTNYKISAKASDVFLTCAAYQQLAQAVDCPLHIGITEAGAMRAGTVRSAIGLGNLLWSGIGDTIRVSLSEEPVEEVRVGFEILKSLGLRHRGVTIISCPSCARQGFDVIRTVRDVEARLAHIAEPITLSIIGCVVNGPGEARATDIGFTGGGGNDGMIYLNGATAYKMPHDQMIDHLVMLVEQKAEERTKKSNPKMKTSPETTTPKIKIDA